jgi:hypothetical protein
MTKKPYNITWWSSFDCYIDDDLFEDVSIKDFADCVATHLITGGTAKKLTINGHEGHLLAEITAEGVTTVPIRERRWLNDRTGFLCELMVKLLKGEPIKTTSITDVLQDEVRKKLK